MREYGSAHLHSQVDAVCNGTTVSLALSVDNSLGSAPSTPAYGSAHIHTVTYMQYYTGFWLYSCNFGSGWYMATHL